MMEWLGVSVDIVEISLQLPAFFVAFLRKPLGSPDLGNDSV